MGLAIAILLLMLSPDFLALHALLIAIIGLVSGHAAGRAARAIDPKHARSAGGRVGRMAGLGYALPPMAYYFYRFITFGEGEFERRLAQLAPEQAEAIRKAGFILSAEYFQQQDVSYIFFFLLFGALLGWLLGMVGGLLARRS